MRKFEYTIPGETTVRRTFAHAEIEHDLFDLLVGGELVATIGYQLARRYWLGRISLADLLAHVQKQTRRMI